MIMTEKDAEGKWCPFVRINEGFGPANSPVAVNRPEDRGTYNCIASGCMAWRISEKGYAVELTDHSTRAQRMGEAIGKPQRIEKRQGYDWLVVEPRGYCGLAGAP